MLNSRFQILLRRRQNQFEGADVTVQCNPTTGYAEYVPGTVDNVTPWGEVPITPVAGWYDFTSYIEDAQKISFTWDKVNSGDSSNTITNQTGSNYDKGISAELMFFDSAYSFINDWLLSTECSILNSVEVKIIDLIARNLQPDPAGNYRIFEIKSDNLDYAPVDEPCQFHIKLREQDNNWHCIHKTFIWDNWQNWFEDSTVKEHPCFLTCIEPRPRLVQSVRMALMLLYQSSLVMTLIDFIVNIFDLTEDARNILNANRFVDAPLVRTYVQNVAGKCGLSMDTIFDEGQPWENLCLYYPQAGYMHESNDDAVASPSLAYHFDNRWLITIAELFDKLKVVFAAEWYVTPLNTIVFKHKKDLINLAAIYDFTAVGAEPIYDLRYTFNGEKKPAYGRYEYQDDGSDLASQEMSTLYSDIVDYDGPANNPMLEGEKVKNFEFAPTGFIRDGRAKDYLALLIKDGKLGASILLIIITTVIAGLAAGAITLPGAIALTILFWLWFGEIQIKGTALNNEFVDGPTYSGAVRLTSEQTMIPRLILWDGVSMQQAKCVKWVSLPVPNDFYNPDLVPYDVKNGIDEDNPDKVIYNYDMYFDGDFYGNLFSRYHDVVDNPLKSKETHQDVKWSVDLCEGMLNLFGVFENQYAVIGKIVKLETRDGYDVYVRIGNINVDYDTNKINLKGVVLRRTVVVDQPRPAPEESGEESSSDSGVVPPDALCLRWINNGETTAVGVRYTDCNGFTVEEDILVGGAFCAIEILDLGTGGNIQATDTCESVSGAEAACEKIYVANLQEIEGVDPAVYIYQNTIGDIVWTRVGVGMYRGTLVGAFPLFRTWFEGNTPIPEGQGQVVYFITNNEDWVEINVFDGAGNPSDAALGEALASFEIHTYCATVDAGPDQIICFDAGGVQLAGSITGTVMFASWSTDGDGTFDNIYLLNAVYTPGATDISNGSVTLTLTTDDPVGPIGPGVDSMFITIEQTAIGTFSYSQPTYCQALPSNPSPLPNPMPILDGLGGVFTADAGLIFVDGSPSPTGQVDIENTPVGVYTVTNTVSNSCGEVVETTEIEILALPEETIDYPPGTFSTADGVQSVVFGVGGFLGLFTADDPGLTIDESTGDITPSTSTPGTYTVTFTFISATCSNTTTVVITIT